MRDGEEFLQSGTAGPGGERGMVSGSIRRDGGAEWVGMGIDCTGAAAPGRGPPARSTGPSPDHPPDRASGR